MNMIAKFSLNKVESLVNAEILHFSAVTDKSYDPDGYSDDNTFSKWTPQGELKMTVTNPALLNQLKAGDKYYLNFTKAE